MAKKKKKKTNQKPNLSVKTQAQNNVEASLNQEEVLVESQEEAVKKQNVEVVQEKVQKKPEKKQKQVKKEKRQSKFGKKLKESFAELKNVSWPTFGKVVKQTGVVLGVVVIFTLILFGFDYILKFFFKLLNGAEYSAGELWGSVGIIAAIVLVVVICVIIWAVKRKKRERK